MFEQLTERLDQMQGKKGVWFLNAKTGETYAYHADAAVNAASVIKLFIMAEAYRAARDGEIDFAEEIEFRKEDMLPSCGALTYIEPYGIHKMSVGALIELMIIVSDNSATNLLIDRLGMEKINRTITALGMEGTCLRRRLFDQESAARGIMNTVTAGDAGRFLARVSGLARPALISEAADAAMVQTLLHQRLNGKLHFFLSDVRLAHKTGEDDGVTHDAAVAYDRETMDVLGVMCFCSQNVSVPDFERLMQDAAPTMIAQMRK